MAAPFRVVTSRGAVGRFWPINVLADRDIRGAHVVVPVEAMDSFDRYAGATYRRQSGTLFCDTRADAWTVEHVPDLRSDDLSINERATRLLREGGVDEAVRGCAYFQFGIHDYVPALKVPRSPAILAFHLTDELDDVGATLYPDTYSGNRIAPFEKGRVVNWTQCNRSLIFGPETALAMIKMKVMALYEAGHLEGA